MRNPDDVKTTSRRLNPEVRKHMILDRAAALVVSEGVSAVTMDRIGREAGVSKPLVYAYFQNVTILLQELLLRDQRRLWDAQTAAVSEAKDFDDLIRLTTQTYLKHVEKSGMHVQRLMSEPSVAAVFKERDHERRQGVVDFLAKEMARTLNIPRDIANIVIELSLGMTGTAGEMISRSTVSRKKVEEILIRLYRGNAEVLRDHYGKG
jgi:TetR/AcrR family transcriptional regulator, fatty acid biosynthesis regulator